MANFFWGVDFSIENLILENGCFTTILLLYFLKEFLTVRLNLVSRVFFVIHLFNSCPVRIIHIKEKYALH